MDKFWNFIKNEETSETELYFEGPISSSTWYGDELTPALFKDELNKHPGNLIVWISSPGGDVFAASQIYTMLKNHKGRITVKIDSLAASAASVVAMAGDTTWISPTGMLMIHNPATIAMGNKAEMEKAITLLDEVKESIINAYEEKTHLSRSKIAKMMDEETWMNAKKQNSLVLWTGFYFPRKNLKKMTILMNLLRVNLMRKRIHQKNRRKKRTPKSTEFHALLSVRDNCIADAENIRSSTCNRCTDKSA